MLVIKEYKKILAQNKMKFVPAPGQTFEPSPDRDARMLVTQKWKETLGVAKYDKHPEWLPEPMEAERVEIRMSQHIGVPSVPCVKEGERVERGQLIAEAAEGLSVPQYASIGGVVDSVDPARIIIRRA